MHGSELTLTLHVRVSGDALTGRLGDGAGLEQEFSGWLGLVAAIDAALSGAAAPPEQAVDDTRRHP
jgi:hypothetical protein